jgi:hypothetical protein
MPRAFEARTLRRDGAAPASSCVDGEGDAGVDGDHEDADDGGPEGDGGEPRELVDEAAGVEGVRGGGGRVSIRMPLRLTPSNT